jgi:hypothetical protein
MLTNLIDAIGTWKMEGSWPFNDSWHVTALWQPESICSSSRCVCTLLPYRVPICGGWRRTISFAEPSLVSGFKERERKKVGNKSWWNRLFCKQTAGGFRQSCCTPKTIRRWDGAATVLCRISTMHPNPFLYRLHKLYRPALVHEVFGIIYRPTYIDAESETRTCQLYRKRLLYISF